MDNGRFVQSTAPAEGGAIPPPPQRCAGQLYTVQRNDTLFGISRRFGASVNAILNTNPQIVMRGAIVIGQVICIPVGRSKPDVFNNLKILSLEIFSEDGKPLPLANGIVQLCERVILRPACNHPVSQAFFFLEPNGMGLSEQASLLGVDCPDGMTGVAQLVWQVPEDTEGRVFAVACQKNICAKSPVVPVKRNP